MLTLLSTRRRIGATAFALTASLGGVGIRWDAMGQNVSWQNATMPHGILAGAHDIRVACNAISYSGAGPFLLFLVAVLIFAVVMATQC